MNKKALKEELTKLQERNNEIIGKCELEVRTLDEVENTEFNSNLARMQEIRNLLDEKNLNGSTKIVQERGIIMEKNLEVKKRFYKELTNGEVIEERAIVSQTGEGNKEQTVPEHLVSEVIKQLNERGTLAKDIKIINVPGNVSLFAEQGNKAYCQLLNENDLVEETNMNDLKVIKLGTRRLSDLIVVSKQLLMNSAVYSEQMIVEQLVNRIDNTLAKYLIVGTGQGAELVGLNTLLTDATVTKTQVGDLADELIDITTDLHPSYLKGAKWYLGRDKFKEIVKMKDAQGQYLCIRDLVNDTPVYKLLGFEVQINDEIVDGNIYFGNMRETMIANIQRQIEIIPLKEAYSRNNAIGLQIEMQIDNAIANPSAVRILKPKVVAKSK